MDDSSKLDILKMYTDRTGTIAIGMAGWTTGTTSFCVASGNVVTIQGSKPSSENVVTIQGDLVFGNNQSLMQRLSALENELKSMISFLSNRELTSVLPFPTSINHIVLDFLDVNTSDWRDKKRMDLN